MHKNLQDHIFGFLASPAVEEQHTGYSFRRPLKRLDKRLNSALIAQAAATGKSPSKMVKPQILQYHPARGNIVGVVDIRTMTEHDWDEDEVDIAEAVADRLSCIGIHHLAAATQKRPRSSV